MKEHYLDIHSDYCEARSRSGIKFCDTYPERFLFFVGNRFVLVAYNSCMGRGNEYEFKRSIVEAAIGQNKIFDLYEVNRSVRVGEELRDFRIRNRNLRKYIQQVNYIYSDNSTRLYAITTKAKYLDAICNQGEIDNNYKEARLFLTNSEYEWMLPKLEQLYFYNHLHLYQEDVVEIHRTIEHLTHTINQLTK